MSITGIIFFGDSILAGTGATGRELGCAKLVKDNLSIPVSLKARNWDTSQDGLERLEQDVLKQTGFSHVIVLFGNNDCWLKAPDEPKITPDQFVQNMASMADRIKANNQTPVFCTLQLIDVPRFTQQFPELLEFQKKSKNNVSQFQKIYSDKIWKLSADRKILCIDIRSPLENSIEEVVALDGIHPNDRGHRMIAATILARLKQWDTSLTSSGQLQDSVT